MALEDFTTYTEVDGQACLTVIAAKITALQIRNSNTDSYVYKDKGAAHFGNFEHLHSGENYDSGTTDNGAYCLVWGISDTVNDFANWANGIFLYYSLDPGINKHWLREREANAWGDLDGYAGTRFTRYWYTTKRAGTTLTCKIYTDAARTVLVDTLTITCINTTLRYMYAISSLANTDTDDMNVYSYDLDLQEGGTLNPADDANASDSVKFDVQEHMADDANASDTTKFDATKLLSDNAKASDAVNFDCGVDTQYTAHASDSVSFQMFRAHNIGDTAKASDSLTFDAEINLADIAKAGDLYSDDSPPPPVDTYPCPTFTLHGTSTAILFPKPEWANPNNEIGKNVSLFNFKSGDLDTVDRGISAQPLTLGGTICICPSVNWKNYAVMTTWLDSIKDAMNNGERFTINELGDCLNGVYVIGDFVFNTLKGTSDGFTWSLSLERIKDV